MADQGDQKNPNDDASTKMENLRLGGIPQQESDAPIQNSQDLEMEEQQPKHPDDDAKMKDVVIEQLTTTSGPQQPASLSHLQGTAAAEGGAAGDSLNSAIRYSEAEKLTAVLPTDLEDHFATIISLNIGLASLLRCPTEERVLKKLSKIENQDAAEDILDCIMTIKEIAENLGIYGAKFAPVIYITAEKTNWATLSKYPGFFAEGSKSGDKLKELCPRFGLDFEELANIDDPVIARLFFKPEGLQVSKRDQPPSIISPIDQFNITDYSQKWKPNSHYILPIPWVPNLHRDVFVRDEAVRVWNFLDSSFQQGECRRILLDGPPGVGKTSTVIAWAFHRCSLGQRILLITCVNKDSDYSVLLLEKGTVCLLQTAVEPTRVRRIILEDYYSLEYDFLIVDGITQDTAPSIWRALTYQKKKAIVCTSRQVRLHGDEGTRRCTFYSWTWGDYVNAIQCESFARSLQNSRWERDILEQIQPDADDEYLVALMKTKYYYAGGSARFMFQYPIEVVTQEIKASLNGFNHENENSDGMMDARNTLIQVFPNCEGEYKSIISMYAANLLVAADLKKLVNSLIYFSCNNPSVMGFVFEAQIIMKMKKERNITLSNLKSLDYVGHSSLHLDFKIKFDQIYDLPVATKVSLREIPLSTILIPTNWNNPCYDWAVVVEEDENCSVAQLSTTEHQAREDQKQLDLTSEPGASTRSKRIRLGSKSKDKTSASKNAVRTLYTFQATVANTHKVKTKYLLQLCESFGADYCIERVFHTFVVPHENWSSFSVGAGADQKISLEEKSIPVKYFVGSTRWISH